jgi:hypothetical protein
LGFPGQKPRQIAVLRLLLKYLEEFGSPGSLVKPDMKPGEFKTLLDNRRDIIKPAVK